MSSKILRLFEQPWAITEQALDALVDIALKLKLPERITASGSQQTAEDRLYAVKNGVAIIPVEGTLYKRSYFFSCGTTYAWLRHTIADAMSNPDVSAILLDIDSPGGGVGGVSDLAEYIYSLRGKIPVYAFTDSQMTSAAYWLGSAAQMVAASPVAQVGSIGVITMHTDYSKADEQAGIKRTYITAGEYKAIGNDAEPLNKKSREYIQSRLDAIYSIFVDTVARHRGVSIENALEMADGKVFLAEEAKNIGMIDLVTSKERFLEQIAEEVMDLKELQAKHPDLVQQIRSEAVKEVEAKKQEEIKAEQDRILGLAEALLGKEVAEKLGAVVKTGLDPEQAKAVVSVLAAQQSEKQPDAEDKKEEILAALKNAHGEGVKGNVPEPEGKENILLQVIRNRNNRG